MNTTRHIASATLACFYLLAAVTAWAQPIEMETEESDFQARTGFSIDKKITKGLHITWSEELRMKNRLSDIDRIYSAIAVSYDILPWLKAGVDYTFIAVKQNKGWEYRNRSNIDVTASYKVGAQWKFSLRERFRITSANKVSDPRTEVNPTWVMRSRLMAEYTVSKLPLRPYAYFELSNTLNTPAIIANYIDKIRASIGIKYTLTRRSEFDFFYRFDHNRSKEVTTPTDGMPWIIPTKKQNNHILGVFYEYSF